MMKLLNTGDDPGWSSVILLPMILGEDIKNIILFAHAMLGCDTNLECLELGNG